MTAGANGQALTLRLFRPLPPGLYRRPRWSPLAEAGGKDVHLLGLLPWGRP